MNGFKVWNKPMVAALSAAIVPPAPVVVNPAVTRSQAIKHVVVIFDENVSFDHYFGVYPNAANPSGEPCHVGFNAER